MNEMKLYAFSIVIMELSLENRISDAVKLVLGYLSPEEEAFVFEHLETGGNKLLKNVTVTSTATNESDNSKRLAVVAKLKDNVRKERASK